MGKVRYLDRMHPTIRGLASLLLLCSWSMGKAQGQPLEKMDTVYDLGEVQFPPVFPGGQDSLFAFIRREVRYPEDAVKAKAQGKVYVEFTVDPEGMVTNVVLRRKIHPSLDEEAMRVVRKIPQWTPARNGDVPVAIKFTLPVNFTL
jgi:TonB family protein